MAKSALYYPYIHLPETGALNAVLLYWDDLAAIIPKAVSPSGYTSELVSEGLVTPIAPSDYVNLYDREFLDGFAGLLDDLSANSRPSPPMFVHADKGSHELWRGPRGA
jgi:hypothetical protein